MEYVNVIMLRRWIDEIKAQMNEIGIESGIIDHVVINRRAKSFWGRCTKLGGTMNHFKIEVTELLLECSEENIKETLAHELVHTCKGCMNHGENFKRVAKIMNEKYKYNIKRETTEEEKGLEVKVAEKKREYKYILQCKECSHQYFYYTKTKYVKNYDRCTCGKCHGKLNLIKL